MWREESFHGAEGWSLESRLPAGGASTEELHSSPHPAKECCSARVIMVQRLRDPPSLLKNQVLDPPRCLPSRWPPPSRHLFSLSPLCPLILVRTSPLSTVPISRHPPRILFYLFSVQLHSPKGNTPLSIRFITVYLVPLHSITNHATRNQRSCPYLDC